jgi:hypothetical protein
VWATRIIPERDLTRYIPFGEDQILASRVRALYEQQKQVWPGFRQGHDALRRVEARKIDLGGCWVLCQHTPHRIASVAARVDPVSVMRRSCFLCPENLYPEEKGLSYEETYLILCNVSPIFDFHFVITHRDHVLQQIEGHFDTTLKLTRDLSPHFVLIYNGPRCGASAPDHLHFQILPDHNLPLPDQIRKNPLSRDHGPIIERDEILIAAPPGFSRRFLILESRDPAALSVWFHQTLTVLAEIGDTGQEPMINLVMKYGEGQWTLILFPRGKHRPRCYHGRGDEQLLISPGAIDMAGVFVIPRKTDYDRVNAATLAGIYREVTLPEDQFRRLIETLKRSAEVKGKDHGPLLEHL